MTRAVCRAGPQIKVTLSITCVFTGFRFIAVSQGIDSAHEQADVLIAVHGLVDSLYIKERGKKTHSGLEGRALKGLHTGGRCFGYRNASGKDGVHLVIDEAEAVVVGRIFEWSANGMSLKAMARKLNTDRVPSPRPRKGRQRATWCPTAIRACCARNSTRGSGYGISPGS
jgi:DNA invertase Pin-like site-specific DNA recombinase